MIVTDLEHMLIPNAVVYSAWGIVLLVGLLNPLQGSLHCALTVAVSGGGALCLIYLAGHLVVRVMSRVRASRKGPSAFRLSDVQLGTYVGLVTGYSQVFWAILLAILLRD